MERSVKICTAPYQQFFTYAASDAAMAVDQSTGDFYVGNPSGSRVLEKYSSAGVLDSAFVAAQGTGFNQPIYCIAVQPDGKILIGGLFSTLNGVSTPGRYVIRLNTNGSVDNSFDAFFNSAVTLLTLQPDGKVLVGGSFSTLNGVSTPGRFMRLNSDGSVDSSFSTNIGTGTSTTPASIAIQSTGVILVGCGTTFNGATVNRLVALNSDGTANTTFNTNLGTGFNSGNITGLCVLSDDTVIVGGTSFTTFNSNARVRNVKLNSDGTENGTFYTNTGAFAGSANLYIERDSSDNVYITDSTSGSKVCTSAGVLLFYPNYKDIFSRERVVIYRTSSIAYWLKGTEITKTAANPTLQWIAPAGVTEILISPSTGLGVSRIAAKTLRVVPNTTYSITINSPTFALNTANTFGSLFTWTGSSSLTISWIE